MSAESRIIEKIRREFSPLWFNLENESHMHSSGRGAESHFKLTLVSEQFNGLKTVARHREIYRCLADELAGGVHALALHLYTAEEWAQRGGLVPKSPNCLGVGQ